jgi:FkbM family methyltransferase
MYECDDDTAGIAAQKVTRLMRRRRPYELPLLDHIFKLQLTGTAVDVGANIGNHALWFAAICKLDVVAFEPLVWHELRRNVVLNALEDKIHVVPHALGDDQMPRKHVGDGLLRPAARGMEIRRLDDYGIRNVSMIKVDVEGMEANVLAGGQKTITRDRPVIFAEEWEHENDMWHDAIAAVLEPINYRMTYLFTGREAATPVGKWEYQDET